MPLISGSTALETPFSPAQGPFCASQETIGRLILQRRFDGTGPWFNCGYVDYDESIDVPNPVAGVTYRWRYEGTPPDTIVCQANQ